MSRYITRQDQVVAALGDAEVQALVVSDLTNVRYLCGYVGSNGTLVVSPSRRVLLTDFRYLQSAAAQTKGVEIVEAGRDLALKLAAVIGEIAATRVGFESAHVSHARHARMVADLPGVELVPTSGIVESVRIRKDADEIDVIARASTIADLAFQACVDGVFRGRTEREVAWELGSIMRAAGADGPSFDIIVASGERGAMPHAVPADVPIPADTLVTVDLGAALEGYVSDCTRTFATGSPSDELLRIYDVCLQAQLAAVQAVRPGISGAELDAVARTQITEAGYGDFFRHGLGHGVGLQVHEDPGARPESNDMLQTGMTITVEPGIYVPDLGGCRIEDLCVVTDGGCDVVTSFPKGLITVDS
jgi:Xaa-Pro aminopeptidase